MSVVQHEIPDATRVGDAVATCVGHLAGDCDHTPWYPARPTTHSLSSATVPP